MIRFLRQYIASRRLQRMVDERRASFEHRQFLKHREAAFKGMKKATGAFDGR